MNLKTRLLVGKVKPLQTFARIVMYNGSVFFYKKKYKELHLEKKFHELKDAKKGKRCFIIGNGPSLLAKDLDRLIGEDCFASNSIYKLFPETKWRPTYYMLMDRYIKITEQQIESTEAKNIFLGDYFWRFNDISLNQDQLVCLHVHYPFFPEQMGFSEDISKYVYAASTVSYGLMQVAAYMGYKEVVLLGFDHNYGFEIAADGTVVKTGADAHFYKDEIPNEIISDVLGMTRAYESFKRYAKEHGIVVKNATRGGKLEVFERVDFDELMKEGA